MIVSDPVIIAAVVLIALVGTHLFTTAADILNATHISPVVPERFSDVYEASRYKKSQHYLIATTRLDIIASSLDMAWLLILWFCKGFGFLDQWVRQVSHSPIVAGLLFIGVLSALKLIINLPFDIWRTFIIEERFGFNKTTPRTFVMDRIKTIIISLILGGTLLSAVLWFFEACGALAWLLCWGATTLFMIGVHYIVPTLIMPLFNTFTPLPPGELKSAIFDYAGKIDFPLTQILVMDGSRRSAKSNAFFTGFGKNRRIVLYDTLIQTQDIPELVAVLAHEMGHYTKKHIRRRLLMGIGQTGILFFLLSFFIRYEGLFHAFYVDQPSVYAGFVFFGLLFSPIDTLLSLLLQFISRRDEIEADAFAAQTTGNPAALVSALKELAARNLTNLTPHPLYVLLNDSHPPVLERIERLSKAPRNR